MGPFPMDGPSRSAEAVEREFLVDLHRAASPESRRVLGLQMKEIGGALVCLARHDPSPLLNRAIGLGVGEPATRGAVSAILDMFADAGVRRFYVHLHPHAEPGPLADWLREAGLVKVRGWMKFRRAPAPPPPESGSPLEVRLIGPEHVADFGRIAASSFNLTEAASGLFHPLAHRPRWHLFMSFSGEEPAGTGALFVHDKIGWLDWASTHPGHRRKGSQRSLLARRIQEAARLGCHTLLTETGEAVEGDPQHSYRNIMSSGFEPFCLRENFSLP